MPRTIADVHYVQPSSAMKAEQICSSPFILRRNGCWLGCL